MKRYKILTTILALLPLILCLAALPFLPEQVPVHFDIHMQVNRWGSKYETLLVPLCCIAMVFLMKYVSKAADKQENQGKNNEKIVRIVTPATLVLLNILHAYTLYLAFQSAEVLPGAAGHMAQIISFALGGLMIVTGNLMPKAKKNTFIGLRTRWSMKNDAVWKKCQLFCGISAMAAGVVMIAAGILFEGAVCLSLSMGAMLISIISSTVYSYVIAKTDQSDPE